MYYLFIIFRRLRKMLPLGLLLNIYKSYVQSKIDHGLSIWGCATEVSLNRSEIRICIRLSNVITLVLCTTRLRSSVCFSNVFMASHHIIWVMTSLCMLTYMGMTQKVLNIWIYMNNFKHNYRLLNGWIHPDLTVPFICTTTLYRILMLFIL